MDRRSYDLMCRMIRHSERVRMPKDEHDRAENLRAVRMITLIGCLDYAMMSLRDELESRGIFMRIIKHNFNKASHVVECMHKEVYDLIYRVDGVAVRTFNDLRDRNWWSIDEHVHYGGVEGAYCVIMSLCRLIESCNASISNRYTYRSVDRLKHVRDMLSVLGVEDKKLDIIIDKAVVIK